MNIKLNFTLKLLQTNNILKIKNLKLVRIKSNNYTCGIKYFIKSLNYLKIKRIFYSFYLNKSGKILFIIYDKLI